MSLASSSIHVAPIREPPMDLLCVNSSGSQLGCIVPEADGLPCLEVLLSGAFDPVTLECRPLEPLAPRVIPHPRAIRSRRRQRPQPKVQPIKSKGKRGVSSSSEASLSSSSLSRRKRTRRQRADQDNPIATEPSRPCPSVVADLILSIARDDAQSRRAVVAAADLASLGATARRNGPSGSAPSYRSPVRSDAARVFDLQEARAGLQSICCSVGLALDEAVNLMHTIDALLSIPPALALQRRPDDVATLTRAGWMGLAGNHEATPLAGAIPVFWGGRTSPLASVGLGVVAPSAHTPDGAETPAARALSVLAREVHMPWFVTRVRAAVDQTLGRGSSSPCLSLFDVVPMDVFLVANVDGDGIAQPYDIYVVPRVDLLMLQQHRQHTASFWPWTA